MGDGSFVEVAEDHEVALGHVDVHGAAWADYDNDGDDDLLAVTGGKLPDGSSPDTSFYINQDGTLYFADPQQTGLTYGHTDRTPTWFDENKDGLLDVLIGSKTTKDSSFPSPLFRQGADHTFMNVTIEIGLFGISADWVSLMKCPVSDKPDLIANSGVVHRWVNNQWKNVTNNLFEFPNQIVGTDYAYGDVNNDGNLDLYVVRQGTLSEIKESDTKLQVAYKLLQGEIQGVDFKGVGVISIYSGLSISPGKVRLGSQEIIPEPGSVIVLDSNDINLAGQPSLASESDTRLYIWYSQDTMTWHFRTTNALRNTMIELEIIGENPITDSLPINLNLSVAGAKNFLFLGDSDGGFTNDNNNSNLSFVGPNNSAVMGDFDNDMDLDVYIVNRTPFTNLANQLFENLGSGTFIEVDNAGGAEGSILGSGDSVVMADYNLDGYIDLFVANGRSDMVLDTYDGPYQLFKNLGGLNHWIQIDLVGTNSNRDGIGAFVETSSGGKSQYRFQDGGVHRYSQNYRRLHFGLSSNELVDRIVVNWPSGIRQSIENVPVDQVIQIFETDPELSPGIPASISNNADGVYLWKNTYDGPYSLRTVKTDPATTMSIKLLCTGPFAELTLLPPTSLLEWQEGPHGFIYRTNMSSITGGVDFQLPPEVTGLLAVEGNENFGLRQLKIGADGFIPTPAGWILNTATLPLRPPFTNGQDLGLFLGKNNTGDAIEFRWNGNGVNHIGNIGVMVPDATNSVFETVKLEARDIVNLGNNWINIKGGVSSGYDGLDTVFAQDMEIGFTYLQDSLFQPRMINYSDMDHALGKPNAFLLPQPSHEGTPTYDSSIDANLFLWRDENRVWHLRATAGGGGIQRYAGVIVSDKPAVFVKPKNIESDDIVDMSDPTQIVFDLTTVNNFFDGINFKFPKGSRLSLMVTEPSSNPAEVVRIGGKKWPIKQLPVVLLDTAEFNSN